MRNAGGRGNITILGGVHNSSGTEAGACPGTFAGPAIFSKFVLLLLVP